MIEFMDKGASISFLVVLGTIICMGVMATMFLEVVAVMITSMVVQATIS